MKKYTQEDFDKEVGIDKTSLRDARILSLISQIRQDDIDDLMKGLVERIKELDGNGGAYGTPTIHIIAELSDILAHLKTLKDKV